MLCLLESRSVEFGKINPTTQVTYAGHTVLLECGSVDSAKWFKSGSLIEGNRAANTLVLKNVTEKDGGTYTCYGTMPSETGNVRFSDSASVLVGGMYSIYEIYLT